MNKRELNRNIKRMYNSWAKSDQEIDRKEFKRLYYADTAAQSLNLKSLKIMIVLNRRYNVIPHHFFYVYIDL